MKINSINHLGSKKSSDVSFKALSLNKEGALKLAGYFVENPGLEDIFVRTIAKPLETFDTIVRFNGQSVSFKTPFQKYFNLIVEALNPRNKYPIALVTPQKKDNALRNCQMLNHLLNPSYVFQDMPKIFKDLETAKNIAEDAFFQKIGYKNQTVQRKFNNIHLIEIKEPGLLAQSADKEIISYEKYSQKAQELLERYPEI